MNYLIFGFGKSGKSAFDLLYSKKHTFFVFDDSEKKREEIFEAYKTYPNVFALKDINDIILDEADQIILSPAVSVEDKRLKGYKSKIFSELDIGFVKNKGKIIAITGTNGKTTTTSLVSHILSVSKKKNYACGNIGTPLSLVAKKRGIKVCEESSFQIESSQLFLPDIFCLLNITPDHIDRHKTFSSYKKIKLSPLFSLSKKQVAVLNANITLPKNLKCNIYTFGKICKKGCYTKDNFYVFCDGKREEKVCKIEDSKLLGLHNRENIMCAITICKLLKISTKNIAKGIASFEPAGHRMEMVYSDENLKIYDDSKATNIDATIKCAQAFKDEKEVYLILGGSLKGETFEDFFEFLPANISRFFFIGEARFSLEQAYKKSHIKTPYTLCKNLKTATNLALLHLKSGVILLSPACASFDEFYNYKDRGEKFVSYIKDFFDKKGK